MNIPTPAAFLATVCLTLAACAGVPAPAESPVATPSALNSPVQPEVIPTLDASPQDAQTARVQGRLVSSNPSVTPISGMVVYVAPAIGDLTQDKPLAVVIDLNKVKSVTVNQWGQFVVGDIEPGQYALAAVPYGRAAEFYQITISGVPAQNGQNYMVLKGGEVRDLGTLVVDFTPVPPAGSR